MSPLLSADPWFQWLAPQGLSAYMGHPLCAKPRPALDINTPPTWWPQLPKPWRCDRGSASGSPLVSGLAENRCQLAGSGAARWGLYKAWPGPLGNVRVVELSAPGWRCPEDPVPHPLGTGMSHCVKGPFLQVSSSNLFSLLTFLSCLCKMHFSLQGPDKEQAPNLIALLTSPLPFPLPHPLPSSSPLTMPCWRYHQNTSQICHRLSFSAAVNGLQAVIISPPRLQQ